MFIIDGALSIAVSLDSSFSKDNLENPKGRRLAGAAHSYRAREGLIRWLRFWQEKDGRCFPIDKKGSAGM